MTFSNWKAYKRRQRRYDNLQTLRGRLRRLFKRRVVYIDLEARQDGRPLALMWLPGMTKPTIIDLSPAPHMRVDARSKDWSKYTVTELHGTVTGRLPPYRPHENSTKADLLQRAGQSEYRLRPELLGVPTIGDGEPTLASQFEDRLHREPAGPIDYVNLDKRTIDSIIKKRYTPHVTKLT